MTTDRLLELLELRARVLLDIDLDGRHLVGDDESGSMQLVEVDLDGTRTALTDRREPCSGRYLPGERTIVVSSDDGGTERAQLWLLRDGELSELVQDPAFIHTLLDVAPGRVVYSTNRRNGVDFDVIVREVDSGDERVIWDGGGWFEAAAVSPDERWVVLSRMTLLAASSELLLVEVATGAVTALTDATVPGDWSSPRWLTDSAGFYASSDAGAEFVSLRKYDIAASAWTVEVASDRGDVRGWPSPDGKKLAVITTVDGADSVTVHDLIDGTEQEIALPHRGVAAARTPVRWAPDSATVGFTFASPVQPPEVFPLGAAVAGLVDPASHLVPTPDGEQIPTYVYRPTNPDGSAVLIIHGGPEAASVRSWSPVAAAMALAGHTVIVPNVRGSAGYGRRWMAMDDVEKRLDSVADLAALHAWAPSIGVDPDRIALYGGSYGGYMVLAGLAFQPELWAAGVDIVGMSSLVTFLENTSPYRRAYREREYGRLETDRAVLAEASPLRAVTEIAAPLLVIHGANDPRVPLSEAEQVVAAVRARGITCDLLVYHDEGHGLAKRANRLDAYPQALGFLARHLKSNVSP